MIFSAAVQCPVFAKTVEPPGVVAFVQERHLTRYSVALADLNDNRCREALIYAISFTKGGLDPNKCGSGGGETYVLSLSLKGDRLLTDIAISCAPIEVLPTSTHGWHDLGVLVAGADIIHGYEARPRFDGKGCPENPSVPPAIGTKRIRNKTIVIAKHPPVPTHAGSTIASGGR